MIVQTPMITGLVLNFRTPGATMECLHTLVQEGIRRIVLVDNSEDGGQSLVAMATPLAELRTLGVDIAIVDYGHNLGFAKGVNVGLSRATVDGAETVLLINSDAKVETGAVSRLAKELEYADIVIPRVRDESGNITSLFGYYRAMTATLADKRSTGCLKFASGCCMLMRSDIIQNHAFDEDFFFYSEDVALAAILTKSGAVVKEEAAAVIVHAGSGSSKNGSLFYEYHINRGHWLLAEKLAGNAREKTLYIACRCITLPLRASVRCWRFKSLVPWSGLIAATIDTMRERMRTFTPPG